ncbi:MAG: hypothetical protein KDK40_02715 [Chlamydiia bacterium]|nr:hypothetical protein [Chlamydiia bacterium]
MISQQELLAQLEGISQKKLQLKLNENRSTMISLRTYGEGVVLSLHKMFLNAPEAVLLALGRYIADPHNCAIPEVKAYIDTALTGYFKLTGSSEISCEHQGDHFHLGELYSELNDNYFEGQLDHQVTWYGAKKAKSRRKVTLGSFHHVLNLIKIHRLLDSTKVPRKCLAFVLYHEMLHSLCLPSIDGTGRRSVHTEEFKIRERDFEDYEVASSWFKENQHLFFVA